MKSLVRQQFLDQTWDAAHLDDAAKFWLQLYDIAAKFYGYSTTPRYSLEVRLWGFARKHAETLADKLRDRATAMHLPDPAVVLTDPDTMLLSTSEVETPTLLPTGLGLPLLMGPEFEGLAVEFRFRVIGRTRRGLGISVSANVSRIDVTLVVVGEVRDGNLLVKAVWKSHRGFTEDEYYRTTPMPGELEFIGALDQFRRSGAVTRHELGGWFAPAVAPGWSERLGRWTVTSPFGRPRFLGVFFRFGILSGIVAAVLRLFYVAVTQHDKGLLGMSLILAAVGVILLWQFLYAECGYLFCYRATRRANVKANEDSPDSIQYGVLTADETSAVADDPAIRKYTADLVAEGFVLVGDVAKVPVVPTVGGYRIFRARDGVTYLVLCCWRTHGEDPATWGRAWPASVHFEAQTFFQGGGRVNTDTLLAYAYRRRATGPTTLLRSLPEMTDVLQFYGIHTETVEAFAGEKGLNPARHGRFEDYIREQEVIYAEEWQYARDHPYSLGDHLWWYLQWPRREQRG